MEHDDHTALINNEQSLTYQQLDDTVERVACYLRRQGIGRDQVVGIIAEHNAQTVMAVCDTLRCGAVFLPLDPALLMTRLYAMCRKVQVIYILYDLAIHELTQALALPTFSLLQALATLTLVRELWPAIEPRDPAYMLFTSGSTGEPKGVQVPHGDLVNYLYFAAKRYFTARDRAAFYSLLSFDLTITTLLVPLCVGASISVCRHAGSEVLLHVVVVDQPNAVIKLMPAYLRLLCVTGISNGQVRILMVGGEDFKRDPACRATALFPQAVIYNGYGPTEATADCIIYRYTG